MTGILSLVPVLVMCSPLLHKPGIFNPICMLVPSSSFGKEIGPDVTQGAAVPKRIKRDPADTTKPLRVRRFGGKHGLFLQLLSHALLL